MTSKQIVSGKHPLTVRVEPALYAEMRRIAAELNVSVPELIVMWCEVMRSEYNERQEE